jgi:hypothetical protein
LKVILFLLLCVITLLFLRRWRAREQTGAAPRGTADTPPPAASPEEIVDVSFEECDAPDTAPKSGR